MAYIGSSPTKVVSRQSANIFTYTATANQTAFTGSDASGNTLACTPSDIMVHMNGIKLEESDFTASTTTVTLGSGAAAGDEVTITAFVTFETADAYTKSAADTRYVNVTGDGMTGNLGVGGAANGSYAITSHSSGGQNLRFENDNEYAFFRLDDSGDLKIWVHGDDNLVFMNGTGSGTTQMNIDGSGHVTMPNQPAFFAKMSSDMYNVGNGAVTLQFNSEVFDQNADFNTSNYTFTAPVTGRYMIGVNVNYNAWDASGNYVWMQINTSNAVLYIDLKNANALTSDGYYGQNGSILCDMDAGDTAQAQIAPSGFAAQMDIMSSTSSQFYGYLVA